MFRYEIILYWSDEDEISIAAVSQQPGCMARGDTQEEALASINEAMALWIDTAKETRLPVTGAEGREVDACLAARLTTGLRFG